MRKLRWKDENGWFLNNNDIGREGGSFNAIATIVHNMKSHERKPRTFQWRLLMNERVKIGKT